MKPTRLILIRHGKVSGRPGVLYSQHDIPLAPEGIRQSELLVKNLEKLPLAAVYASDLSRAKYPAELLAQKKDLPLIVRKELREIDFGAWSGKSYDELLKIPAFQERLKDPSKIKPPQGETLKDLRERALSVIKEACEKFSGENVVFFTHGGLLRVVILWALGASLKNFFRLQIDYGAINLIDFYTEDPLVRLVNAPYDLDPEKLNSNSWLV
ncbi:histidine phosphatase family protein [Thermodesulfatator atlanticus]|uniref:histidine phosphatase family protein n=1 Tax=Thermodesulfatator atlanticus TaxID=501497 RepID=UPI0003B43B17|nr:histidine phosphatase family protein [Thermodesulfatator atlanticus]